MNPERGPKPQRLRKKFSKRMAPMVVSAIVVACGMTAGAGALASDWFKNQPAAGTSSETYDPNWILGSSSYSSSLDSYNEAMARVYDEKRLKDENIDLSNPTTFAKYGIKECLATTAQLNSSSTETSSWVNNILDSVASKAEAAPQEKGTEVKNILECFAGIEAESPSPFKLGEKGFVNLAEQNVLGTEPESIEFWEVNLVKELKKRNIDLPQEQVDQLLGKGNGSEVLSVFKQKNGKLAPLVLKTLDDKKVVDVTKRPHNLIWRGEKGWILVAQDKAGKVWVTFIVDIQKVNTKEEGCGNVFQPVGIEKAATATATATSTSTTLTATASSTPKALETSTATVKAIDTSTSVATNTATSEATNTSTEVPTSTNTPVNTATPENTVTPINTATNTVTETSTPKPTKTSTPVNTATNTAIPTETPFVPQPPTSVATSTKEPTRRLPSPTPFNTVTPYPIETVIPGSTNTPLPTNTRKPTATPFKPSFLSKADNLYRSGIKYDYGMTRKVRYF